MTEPASVKKRDDVRDRIRRRLEKLNLTAAELDRDIGVGASFTHDFLAGRKRTLTDYALERMAGRLRTTEIWIAKGYGPEEIGGPQTTPMLGVNLDGFPASEISEVSGKERKNISITSLDLVSGRAVVVEDGKLEKSSDAIVVDPVIFLAGNAYVQSFGSRKALKATFKRVKTTNDKEILFIIDAA